MTLGIYSVAADISVCPGIEYQDIPGGKGGRCVRVTTLPPSCAECLVIWSLNRPEPSGPHRPVIGVALLFFFYQGGKNILPYNKRGNANWNGDVLCREEKTKKKR